MISVPRNDKSLGFVRKLQVVKSAIIAPAICISLAVGVVATLISCKPQNTTDSSLQNSGVSGSAEATTPEGKLHDQLSSGSFQADASVSTIAGAIVTAEGLSKIQKNGDAAASIADVLEVLNLSGKTMAEISDEIPNESEIKRNFAKYDDLRIKAVELANDCLHDLDEANGILDALKPDLTSDAQANLISLQAQIAEAMDDVIGTIDGFGGKVEPIG